MRTQGDMIAFSKAAALKLISDRLGFLNPSARYLFWYFDKEEDDYVLRVNLDSLSKEIESKDYAAKMAKVAKLPDTDSGKNDLIAEIHAVVKKYELLSKVAALKLISDKLGFPKPSPRYLGWYFNIDEDGLYTQRVDFDSLAKEMDEEEFVERLADVIKLPRHHLSKETVFMQIRAVIKKHEM